MKNIDNIIKTGFTLLDDFIEKKKKNQVSVNYCYIFLNVLTSFVTMYYNYNDK